MKISFIKIGVPSLFMMKLPCVSIRKHAEIVFIFTSITLESFEVLNGNTVCLILLGFVFFNDKFIRLSGLRVTPTLTSVLLEDTAMVVDGFKNAIVHDLFACCSFRLHSDLDFSKTICFSIASLMFSFCLLRRGTSFARGLVIISEEDFRGSIAAGFAGLTTEVSNNCSLFKAILRFEALPSDSTPSSESSSMLISRLLSLLLQTFGGLN